MPYHSQPTSGSSSLMINGRTPCFTVHPLFVRAANAMSFLITYSPVHNPSAVVNELCERLTFYGLATKYACTYASLHPQHRPPQPHELPAP